MYFQLHKEYVMAVSLTSNQILKELSISRSTFYYLLKNKLISIPTTKNGRYIWSEETIDDLRKTLQLRDLSENIEEPQYKTTKINNKRCLGDN